MKKTNIIKLLSVLLIIIFSILPLFLSSYFSIFNKSFYKKEFTKYNIYQKYEGINLDDYNDQVLDYLKGGKENMPDTISLTGKELVHMKDVKNIFSGFLLLFNSLLIISIILLVILISFNKKKLSKIFFYSGIFSLALSIVLLLFFYFSFISSFTIFHNIFFEENSWLFNPYDNIINIYPVGFFFDISLKIFLGMIILSLLLLGMGLFRKTNNH